MKYYYDTDEVWLVEKGKLGGELRGLTSTP